MTSKDTNNSIKNILDKFLTREQQLEMLRELKGIKGNESFKKTIENIYKIIVLK